MEAMSNPQSYDHTEVLGQLRPALVAMEKTKQQVTQFFFNFLEDRAKVPNQLQNQ